jgi:hypothetical protein
MAPRRPAVLSCLNGVREGRAPGIGCPRGELVGGQIAQAGMRPFPTVLDAPFFDLAVCIDVAAVSDRPGESVTVSSESVQV